MLLWSANEYFYEPVKMLNELIKQKNSGEWKDVDFVAICCDDPSDEKI